jgi:hypothetical protein
LLQLCSSITSNERFFEFVEFDRTRVALARHGGDNFFFDLAGAIGHHDDAVGKVDGFFNAVSDEDDGLFEFHPDTQ